MRVLFLISMLALVSLLGASFAAARYVRGARRKRRAGTTTISGVSAEDLRKDKVREEFTSVAAAPEPAGTPQGDLSDPKPPRPRDSIRTRAVATHR